MRNRWPNESNITCYTYRCIKSDAQKNAAHLAEKVLCVFFYLVKRKTFDFVVYLCGLFCSSRRKAAASQHKRSYERRGKSVPKRKKENVIEVMRYIKIRSLSQTIRVRNNDDDQHRSVMDCLQRRARAKCMRNVSEPVRQHSTACKKRGRTRETQRWNASSVILTTALKRAQKPSNLMIMERKVRYTIHQMSKYTPSCYAHTHT